MRACSSLNKTVISAELCCRGEWAIVILAEWLHQGMEPLRESRTISPVPETESPLIAKTAPIWATDDNLIVEKGALGKGTLGQSSTLSGDVGRSFISLLSSQVPGSLDLLSKSAQPASCNEFSECYWDMKERIFPSSIQTRGTREPMPSVWPPK